MTKDSTKTIVISLLNNIAPEIDYETLSPDENLRESLDIDSIDFLNFMIALNEKTGVEIPESVYSRLTTINEIINHIRSNENKNEK